MQVKDFHGKSVIDSREVAEMVGKTTLTCSGTSQATSKSWRKLTNPLLDWLGTG